MECKRVHIYVAGRVQGVFFRAFVSDKARHLGLAGWVRNRLDGRVEAVFEGPAAAVDQAVAACRQGPPHAHVERILVDDGEPSQGLSGFETKGTA